MKKLGAVVGLLTLFALGPIARAFADDPGNSGGPMPPTSNMCNTPAADHNPHDCPTSGSSTSQGQDQGNNGSDGHGYGQQNNAFDGTPLQGVDTPDDSDNDGVPDQADNCRNASNSDQADDDGDKVGNTCDPTFNDRDHDGVGDGKDNCPNVSNSDQADRDHDGTGNACDTDDGTQLTAANTIDTYGATLGGDVPHGLGQGVSDEAHALADIVRNGS